jgi:hypothetical protein
LEPIPGDERDAFLSSYRQEALHLEMRDIYATDIERDRFRQWLSWEPLDPDAEAEWWRWSTSGCSIARLSPSPTSTAMAMSWITGSRDHEGSRDRERVPDRVRNRLGARHSTQRVQARLTFGQHANQAGSVGARLRELGVDAKLTGLAVARYYPIWITGP